MKPEDIDAWEPPAPPADFAERVVARARAEVPAPGPSRFARVVTGVFAVAAAAAIALFWGTVRGGARRAERGDVVAETRREVRLGERAVAVLEPGASLRWSGADVEQSAGEVFFRVEPGPPFVVKAGGGEVRVKGTCFRVKVLAGAGIVAAIAVAVYEGQVVVAHGQSSLALSAGESAEATSKGVVATGAATHDEPSPSARAEHAVATLDRARADRMRESIRALLAEAGPLWAPAEPTASASASAKPNFPTMPLTAPEGGREGNVDPGYIRSVVRDDFVPLARQCYAAAAEKNPALAGRVELKFRILGDPSIGGVVSEVTLGDRTTIADPAMQTCVTESMMSVSFAAPPHGGELTVTFPIEFSPEDDDGG